MSYVSEASSYEITAAVLLLSFLVLAVILRRSDSGRPNFPPGPKGLPLIGNLHQLTPVDQHKLYARWGAQYGDIVYVKFFRQPVIILNSARAAIDLMEKRGAKYSGRPRIVYLSELAEWSAGGAFVTYNNTWKQHRKWFQQALIARATLDKYLPLQRRQVNHLLLDLLTNPSGYREHLKRYTAAIILDVAYGRNITTVDDEFIRTIEEGIGTVLEGAGTGGTLVDYLPALKYLPSWLPGSAINKNIARARQAVRNLEDMPYQRVRDEMAHGIARPSLVKELVEEYQDSGDLTEEKENLIKSTAAVMYVGGTDTSLTSLLAFVLEMTLHPETLRKLHDEMDCALGTVRLPNFEDRSLLPYLECVIREVFRLYPAGQLGLPHQAAEDDVYRGYYIPKGATVIANIWAMTRDPEVFPEPEEFRPDRFLGVDLEKDEQSDPKKLVFGFGRRVCPGQYLADGNNWLAIANIVATMDICKARDKDGVEIIPNPEFRSGTVSHATPFPCDIHPRSAAHAALIRDACTEN